jgi:hypothetical protein
MMPQIVSCQLNTSQLAQGFVFHAPPYVLLSSDRRRYNSIAPDAGALGSDPVTPFIFFV